MEDNVNIEETTPTYNTTPYSDSELVDETAWSSKYTNGRRGGEEGQNVITNITLHIVDGDWGVGGFRSFANTTRDASSHYGICSDGQIVQMVSEKNTAWTNGGSGGSTLPNPVGSGTVGYNTNSVTIEISNLKCYGSGEGYFTASNGQEYHYKDGKVEMNGEYYTYPITNEALDSTIRLVADIAKRNNIGELYHDGYNGTLTWHRDFPGVYKACPGDYVIAMTDYICESANMLNEKGYYIPDYAISSENGSGLMALVLETENPFGEGTIASDMYTTVSAMNNIRNAMGSVEVQTPSYTSTSTIPGNLMNAESSLLGISSDLNSTIYNETKVISSIAQVFFDMDRERTAAAEGLSDGSELVFDESGYTDVLNELLSYDLTSEIKFDSFLFDPFSHTEGNSGKICLSDLTAMLSGGSLSGPLYENLENERQSALAVQTELDNLNTMISSGTNFKGEVWAAVSQRLSDYSDLMKLRIDSADTLESAIARAIKLIIDYMGEYEELDDSKLPELKEKAEQVKQEILDAQAIVDATHNVKYSKEGENGETVYYTVTEYVYSTSARREARNYITSAKILLNEINKEINKLENLPIVLAEAEQIINDALSVIYSNYGTKVAATVTGKTVSYIPPQNTNYVAPAYTKVEIFDSRGVIEGKVDEDTFNSSLGLQNMYGTYDDYLNGVYRENNPMYNPNKEDNGIEPGESLNDKIFDEPEETDPNHEDISGTPDADKDTGGTPDDSKPETPSDPKPETPSDPKPETPSDPKPETPSDPKPETPSDPKPETPSDPKPETPSDPKPETPSDPKPETPSDPKPETPSDPKPETPSDPKPETPSDPKPETPSDPKPETPSDPKPETPSDPKPETNVTPSQPSNPDGNSGATNPGNTVPETPVEDIPPIVEIPDEPDTPIADAPVIEEPTVDKPVIDITPDYGNDNDNSSSGDGLNLTKAVGISLGVGAAVGAAALGAHTVKKAKDNNIYEDD